MAWKSISFVGMTPVSTKSKLVVWDSNRVTINSFQKGILGMQTTNKKVNEPGVSLIVVVAAEFLTSQGVQGRFHKWFGTRLGCEHFVYGKIKGYFGHDYKTDIVLYILFTLQLWLLRIVLYTLLWTNISWRWLGRRVSWISGTCDRSLEGYPPAN